MTHTHYAGMGACEQCPPDPAHDSREMTCPGCGHPVNEHSREPGIGCLHWDGDRVWCLCQRAGASEADQ